VGTVFLVAAPFAAVAFLVVLLIREVPLRTAAAPAATPAPAQAQPVGESA
jgi:hypothetical protein